MGPRVGRADSHLRPWNAPRKYKPERLKSTKNPSYEPIQQSK